MIAPGVKAAIAGAVIVNTRTIVNIKDTNRFIVHTSFDNILLQREGNNKGVVIQKGLKSALYHTTPDRALFLWGALRFKWRKRRAGTRHQGMTGRWG